MTILLHRPYVLMCYNFSLWVPPHSDKSKLTESSVDGVMGTSLVSTVPPHGDKSKLSETSGDGMGGTPLISTVTCSEAKPREPSTDREMEDSSVLNVN